MVRLVCTLAAATSGCVTLPRTPDRQTAEDTPAVRGQVKWLVEHIDDNPDPIHAWYTPAIAALCECGDAAILPTLDLMLSDDLLTRVRAARVLTGITKERFGVFKARDSKAHERQEEWRKSWTELGNLDANASAEQRAASVKLWKEHFAHLAKP